MYITSEYFLIFIHHRQRYRFFFPRKRWLVIHSFKIRNVVFFSREGEKKNKHSEKDERPFFRNFSGFHVYISQCVYQFDMKSYKRTKKCFFPRIVCVFFSWKSSMVIHSFDLRVVFFFSRRREKKTTFSLIHSIFL